MAKTDTTIVAATGISVGGRSPGSKGVEVAMRDAALAAHAAGHEPAAADLARARNEAKPPERR